MNFFLQFTDIFFHLDVYLGTIVELWGIWTYLILFCVIFFETGFVIAPFLPGDSLLFAAGAFAAIGSLNIWILYGTLFFAAVIGDSFNYLIGYTIGSWLLEKKYLRVIKKEHLERTQYFFQKYGGKTIVIARFFPIVRTFAPFVAGIGKMHYSRFVFFNFIGGFIWITFFLLGGYFFGNLSIVKENFSFVILGIILLSILPTFIKALQKKK